MIVEVPNLHLNDLESQYVIIKERKKNNFSSHLTIILAWNMIVNHTLNFR